MFHYVQCSAFLIPLSIKERSLSSEYEDQDQQVPEDSVQFKLQCTCISVWKLLAVIYINVTAVPVSVISQLPPKCRQRILC